MNSNVIFERISSIHKIPGSTKESVIHAIDLFLQEICQYNASLVATAFDLEKCDVLNVLHLGIGNNLHSLKNIQPETKCIAIVSNKNGKCRCARSNTRGEFCKTHLKLSNEGRLQFGVVKPEKGVMKQCRKIVVKNMEYYFDEQSKRVYDMSNKLIGHLTDDADGVGIIAII